MAIINKGKSFANGEQLTADKLNQVIDNATFASGAVDNVSTQLSGGAIIVKDGGVTEAKLNDNAVTTAKIANNNVTTAKIADANITFAKLTDVIDDDTMATASATKLSTSESIKAYVDSLADVTPPVNDDYVQDDISKSGSVNVGGLILKFGNFELISDGSVTLTFPVEFPNACLMVMTQDTRGTGTSASPGLDVPIVAKSKTGFTVNRYDEVNGSIGLTFLAIGY